MATANMNRQCSICNEEYAAAHCNGCNKSFCLTHFLEHHQEIKQKFHYIEHDYNLFQEKVIDKKNHPMNHSLINKINQWENDSIEKIKQTADECRRKLITYTNKYIIDIEKKLKVVFEQLRKISEKNKFNEISLEELKEKLNKLKEDFDKPTNILVEQEQSSSFINQIFVFILFDEGTQVISRITNNTQWKQHGITVAGGNGRGDQLNRLHWPYGFSIDNDQQMIYIADYSNNHIVEWKFNEKTGQVIAGGNGKGNQTNQLKRPTDVLVDTTNNSLIICDSGNRRVVEWSRQTGTKNGQILISDIDCWGITMDKNGYIYVSDCLKNEVRRWKRGETNETIVAGGNGKGKQLNQLNFPTYLFVDQEDSLYVTENDNHRVMKWMKNAKEGFIVAGEQGYGDQLTQLHYPRGVIVDHLGNVYVADQSNHRIMCWSKGSKQGRIIVGGNGKGEQSNQLNCPIGISFDREDNLYVVDQVNNRVQKFEINK